MKPTWTEVERNAYDITAGDEGESRQNKHYNGDHVDSEFARGLETERDAHFEVLRQVADLFGITDWDSTTLLQQLRTWISSSQEKGMG